MYIFIIYLISSLLSVNAADFYEVLGISKDADNREIRRAFKILALKFHPDKNMGEEQAHEQFMAINQAYETLKDQETRKKYDLHGEEGLKQDFGKTWKGNYHSWNYYSESFGIYDDDPKIITLNKNDFAHSVFESPTIWFVNFYSPQCSHCHDLAPAWRALAHKLEGAVQIAAVNCEEDWILCRQQTINSYPSLVIYPQNEKYLGLRDEISMVDFVLQRLPYNVIRLSYESLLEIVSWPEFESKPWLIFTCKNSEGCINSDDIKKLGIILEHLVNVAEVDKEKNPEICQIIKCELPISCYFHLNTNIPSFEQRSTIIEEVEVPGLVKHVLALLPEPYELTDEGFKEMLTSKQSLTSSPILLQFTKSISSEPNIDLKRLAALLPKVVLARFDCQKYPVSCSALYLHKFPVFVLFKPGGLYELHYGRMTAHDVAQFTQEALPSQVQTLTPETFPKILETESWFIDFFAPWCPPCMQFLPQWRKASQSLHRLVKFGTVDCSIHTSLCREYNINSYPTAILYNQSVSHKYDGSHSYQQIQEFVKDIMNPVVVSLTARSFQSLVESKKSDDIWIVDFFAPWCGPCQKLAPQWRKLSKLFNDVPAVHIGEVDCQSHSYLCSTMGIYSYPTIRLYPRGSNNYFFYSGRNRDALSLQAWIFNFLPSKVKIITSNSLNDALSDSNPWLIDFYVPWCTHCQTFAPDFEKIAEAFEGKVQTAKVNCEEFPTVCKLASINAYPTVMFYKGTKDDFPQNAVGIEVPTLTFKGVNTFLERFLNERFKRESVRDEL